VFYRIVKVGENLY